jgi:hypothetical protein
MALVPSPPASAQGGASGSIHGEVRSEANGAPLAGVTVEVRHGSWSGRTLTDRAGFYRLSDVPAGRSLLRVHHLGHEPLELEVVVPAGRSIALELSLPIRPVALEPVMVDAGAARAATDSLPARPADLGIIGARALTTTPGLAELGIADAVRGVPDHEATDPGSILYVRGATADLKLVHLDGAPVYAPFPLGGLLAPFTPELLHDAQVYLGGAPARYDGGLSYIMDLRTRAGRTDRFRTGGALDLISARMLAEGGVADRLSLIAAGRGMHRLGAPALLGAPLPYGYREALLRADAWLGDTGVLSVTGFANAESVRFGESALGDSVIRWGNVAGSVKLRGDLRGTGAELGAAFGDYTARLPLGGRSPTVADGAARRTRFSADFARRAETLQIRYGASLEQQDYRASAAATTSAAGTVTEAAGRVTGVYAEGASQVGPRVRVRGGARVDHFSATEQLALAPRVAATWLVNDRAALTFAAGRYHQYLRPPDELLLRESAGAPAPTTTTLAVGSASHFTANLDQDLGEGLRLGVEGFYKEFSDIPGSHPADANASGVDVWVRRGVGQTTGWLGYSLAWVWSSGSRPGESDFTGRHLLNAGLEAPLGERTRLDLRFAYGAGLPYVGIPLVGVDRQTAAEQPGNYAIHGPGVTSALRGGTETAPLLHSPDEPFLRLDATLSQLWTPRRGDGVYRIMPYLRVLNSLGRRDALFYFFDGSPGAAPRPIGGLPLVPVAGLEWRF